MFVPKKQQIEGLKFISKHVTMREFSRATKVLVNEGFFKKSKRHKLIKMMRHIKGISWEDFNKIK